MNGILRERRGHTVNGLRIEWRHVAGSADSREYMQGAIRCGAWEWEFENDYNLVWTWDRMTGLAAGLDYIAGMGPDGAAALAATILRNMEPAANDPTDNVIQLRPRKP